MFADKFTQLAKTNSNFRYVLHTGQYAQVVAMSLPVGGDIGVETHPATDQIFIIVEGEGEAMVGDETRRVEEKDLIFVPAGTQHNITNKSDDEDLKLLTFYAPPAHPDGTVETTKAEAAKAEPAPSY